jgi:hypothetical protein
MLSIRQANIAAVDALGEGANIPGVGHWVEVVGVPEP